MDENKIVIVVYGRDNRAFEDTRKTLQFLTLPQGYFCEVAFVIAPNRWAAYNAMMEKCSDAKYKVYLDEAVEIRLNSFLVDMINIFKSDAGIGMIGVAGAEVLSTHGICATSVQRCGRIFMGAANARVEWNAIEGDYKEVDAIDGCFIATQYDIRWRDDLFKENSFGDTAQCVEFKRKGYKTVVANQKSPWVCIKNNELLNHENCRQTFLNEYSKDIFPLVQILLPTFNRPHYLPIALDSALNQTYRNLEITVSDDSTDDKTKQLMESRYVGKDPRMTYYCNIGFTSVQNAQFLKEHVNPNAEYINYLFDDDMFYPQKIELMVEAYRNNPDVSLVTSTRNMIDENGNVTRPHPSFMQQTGKFDGEEMGRLMFMVDDYIGTPVTALVKKEHFNLCWNDMKFKVYASGDCYSWFQLLQIGKMFWFTQPLSAHREHPGEATYTWKASVGLSLDWAKYIKYYWERKIFLKNEKDVHQAIVIALSVHYTRVLRQIRSGENGTLNLDLFYKVMASLTQALINGYKIEWPEEEF